MAALIHPVGSRPHYLAHLEPVTLALPVDRRAPVREEPRRELHGPDDVALVTSYRDLIRCRTAGFRRFVRAEHGAGQSYAGDPASADSPFYAGGRDHADVGLFLAPNAHAADRWARRYPRARVEVVGSPLAESRPGRQDREASDPPVLAVSFHWDGSNVCPEAGSGLRDFAPALRPLARAFKLIGHGHPMRKDLASRYRMIGVEWEPDFNEVCRRADLYIADNTSTLFEFAATGRPVIVLNAARYRRHVNHGLRFWDAADVGVQVADARALQRNVEIALLDTAREQRRAAVELVYPVRDGAAGRSASAILAFADA